MGRSSRNPKFFEEVICDWFLLRQDETLLSDPRRVGKIAPVGGVRVEGHSVGGRGKSSGDLKVGKNPI